VKRLEGRGRVDRSAPLKFSFDGREYTGLRGDTLASALLANGVDVVGTSVYRGRPRGISAAGLEDPGALVQVQRGGGSEPMLRATEVELFNGLCAEGLAGRGRLDPEPDRALYDRLYAHCDVLVIGGGPAGLAAADVAAATGARVMLAESWCELGGDLLDGPQVIDGSPALDWVAGVAARLQAASEAQVLCRATAIGVYDAGYVLIAERRTDHLDQEPPLGVSRERLWHVRAKRVVLAAGSLERPIAFAGNDRPGVMLAGAARAYVERWGVAPGTRAVVFTANDSGYDAAASLAGAGITVAAVVDPRPNGGLPALPAGSEHLTGRMVRSAVGESHVTGAEVGSGRVVVCDLLAVSGGWSPAVHLFSQAGGSVRWDARVGGFVPDRAPAEMIAVGSCAGTHALDGCLAEGAAGGAAAAEAAGFVAGRGSPPRAARRPEAPAELVWSVPPPSGRGWEEHFLDAQRDATVADLRRAVDAGLKSPEHVKRFTTIGTASDQGKTAGVVALGVLADLLATDIAALGPTTFRPPYTPVCFGLLAGRDRGELSDPVRTTTIHPWHVEHGAVFEDVGQWKRPWFYPRDGEGMDAAVLRECRAAREAVAVMDASTLGKIDVQGPDAVLFLNRMYTGDFSKLGVGRCKYGLLCHADGMVFDDGVTMRLAPDRFLVTTTTGNAAAVLDWFEEWLQTEWPDLRVHCTSVTEQWATVAVVGPRSRAVVAALAPDLDVGNETFPFMAIRAAEVAGVAARVCRVSFSGELAFELNVPSWYGRAVWEAVMAAGADHGIIPYGTETMHVLRAEKGYVIVGQDTDGTVTPQDLGLDWMVARGKGDFVGRRSHARADCLRADRKQLVGLLPEDPADRLPEGAQLVLEPGADVPVPMAGFVTSSYDSAALGRTFALALLEGGRARHGATVHAPLPDRTVAATVVDPVLYDPEGGRRDG
jgi:sarcosine oxidase subunit alpha